MRRNFSSSERIALYLAADGRCQGCGCELAAGFHADHIHPHSKGGETTIDNGQALCPKCNRAKGATCMSGGDGEGFRRWQQSALEKLTRHNWLDQKDFLLEATPGAGKTAVGIEELRRQLEEQFIRRVVIAVPGTAVKEQWKDALRRRGNIEVMTGFANSDCAIPDDVTGYVATYAQIAAEPDVHMRLVQSKRTGVVLDELHHLGDRGSWGPAAKHAFQFAAFRLGMSGTPFRSDNEQIPFVRYDNTHRSQPDFHYGYGEALGDKIVRNLFFHVQNGHMEWLSRGGDNKSHTFGETITVEDSRARLRTAVNPTHEWFCDTLAEANSGLVEMRESGSYLSNTGGCVHCIDIKAAKMAKKILKSLGQDAVIVSSEDAGAADKLRAFASGTRPWLVAVHMVSEGVDIPRLRVCVYATNFLTRMYFMQVMGRYVRKECSEDSNARVYIPADPDLVKMSSELRDIVAHQIEEEERCGTGSDENRSLSNYEPLSSSLIKDGGVSDGMRISEAHMNEARKMKERHPGLPSAVEEIATIFSLRGEAIDHGNGKGQPRERDKESRMSRLRALNNSVVAQIIEFSPHTYTYGSLNAKLNRRAGCSSLATATEEQLDRRLELAREIRKIERRS